MQITKEYFQKCSKVTVEMTTEHGYHYKSTGWKDKVDEYIEGEIADGSRVYAYNLAEFQPNPFIRTFLNIISRLRKKNVSEIEVDDLEFGIEVK